MAAAPSPDVDALLSRARFPPAGTAVRCAYSGGADSTALIILGAAAGCRVTAVHVDHGLHPDSGRWADLAAANAATLGVECQVVRAEVGQGPNLEARARAARRELLGPDALTGHSADDRAETVLLNVVRGTGPDGLNSLRPGPTKPLLALRRAELAPVGPAHGVTPLTDPANADARFRRNRVRADVLPLLDDVASRDVVPLLNRLADLAGADGDLLDTLAAELDPTDAVGLAAAPAPLARRALRRWLTLDGYPPDRAAIERVMAVADGTHRSCELGSGRRVERRHQRLRLVTGR